MTTTLDRRALRERAREILSAAHAQSPGVALERVRALVAKLVDDLAVSRIKGERRSHISVSEWAAYEAEKRVLAETAESYDEYERGILRITEKLKR